MMKIRRVPKIFASIIALIFVITSNGVEITDVSLSKASFNPTRGDTITLNYSLSESDKVTISIWDADGGLARTLVDNKEQKAGSHKIEWDGKDFGGKSVPNEAYTVTIEASSGAVYDPTTLSGGVVGDITDAEFRTGEGTMIYRLPAASRVLIRLGVRNGPMLKTLVDWKPRVIGSITEYWDGRDENKIIRFRDHKNFSALITYVTLPDTTVIAYGNDEESYRDYKLGRAKDRPKKPKRPFTGNTDGRLRPENLVPPAWSRAPQVLMTFPKLAEGNEIPKVKEAVDVRIDVEPSDKERLQQEQFEIIFYVDNVFFAEAERGYLPYNWRWELNQIPEGEHILTVNISSFKGQVGVVSSKIQVVKNEE